MRTKKKNQNRMLSGGFWALSKPSRDVQDVLVSGDASCECVCVCDFFGCSLAHIINPLAHAFLLFILDILTVARSLLGLLGLEK